ncbi:MAG: PIG-L family deacetylase, partial [Pseudomonas sp.]|nr:PIG-L family deacetylase [Pseudomonas sp.]
MSRKQQLLKRHRRNKRLVLLVGLVLLVALGVLGVWWLPLLLLALLWGAHEAWFADHLFYSPGEDYAYRFAKDTREVAASLRGDLLQTDVALQGDETLI